MLPPQRGAEVPRGVTSLLHDAVHGRLLTDADSLSASLLACGWVRDVGGGAWTYAFDPAWSIQSSAHAPHVSVFTGGEHETLLQVATAVGTLVESGQVGAVRPGDPDPDWRTWTSDHAVISLNVSPPRPLGTHRIPASIHLVLERPDTPGEGLRLGADDAHRAGRGGSAATRWYLAGVDTLPDDVVALLSQDEDPAVVAALAANEGQRRVTRDHG